MTDAQPEYRNEINQLVGQIAAALEIEDADAVAALEKGEITLDMGEDDQGRFIAIVHNGREARIYKGAIYRPAAGDDA